MRRVAIDHIRPISARSLRAYNVVVHQEVLLCSFSEQLQQAVEERPQDMCSKLQINNVQLAL